MAEDCIWTVRTVLSAATTTLTQREVDSARLDAEILLAHALSCSRLELLMMSDRPLSVGERSSYRGLIKQRMARVPVAYLTGVRGFYGLELQVSPAVLIPRPETEHLVDRALAILATRARAVVADVCTGSGAIALAVAKNAPVDVLQSCIATDVCPEALALAAVNCHRHGLSDTVEFRCGSLCEPLAPERGRIDLLLANPPYVAESDRDRLPAELAFEPAKALFAGSCGFSLIDQLLPQALAHLASSGVFLCEVGADQAQAVRDRATALGFVGVSVHKDYAGVGRVVEAKHAGG